MDKHRETYREEAYGLLSELETALLELEETPNDQDLIDRVFRAMHTIKGSGAMFGFDDIAEFTHEIETVFDKVREGEIPVTKDLISLSLSACDQVKIMVDGDRGDENEKSEILEAFRKMLPDTGQMKEADPEHSAFSIPDSAFQTVTYRIRFRPHQDLFTTGTNPMLLLDEVRKLGSCEVIAQTHAIPTLKDMNPEACYLYWDIILTTEEEVNAIKDVFIFVEDECDLTIDVIEEEKELEEDEAYKKLGKILMERGDVSEKDLDEALTTQKRIGEVLQEKGLLDKKIIDSALAEQKQVAKARKTRKEKAQASSIRVAADKLDTLVDLVGELVTVQARLAQNASYNVDAELVSISEEVERLTGELRDNTMDIRMMPIGGSFARLKRLVRDLSADLGKEVVLETHGGETELDKTVLENLSDPLVHLIRNCIDHAIEMPEERRQAGKSPEGTIRLSATHAGADVVIRIGDDGAGLDPDAIRAKAIEKEMIGADAALSDQEIFMLIFTPGFSTASEVTDVSGRGVGMDVVKRNIEALQGSVSLSSEEGKGTTVTLKVPLTLAIIDGLMVKIGEGDYIFPLSAVEECVEFTREEADRARNRKMMELWGQMVSYVSLREFFHVNEEPPPYEKIVIVEHNSKRIGLGVDSVVGQHQTVLKSLGDMYKDIDGLSGATIKGDGRVALILDVNMLAQAAGQVRH